MSAPTRVTNTTANVPNVILTSNPVMLEAATFLDCLSDHKVIHSFIGLPMSVSKLQWKCNLLYDKANFKQINLELVMFYDDLILGFTNCDIETNRNMFNEKVTNHLPSTNDPFRSPASHAKFSNASSTPMSPLFLKLTPSSLFSMGFGITFHLSPN